MRSGYVVPGCGWPSGPTDRDAVVGEVGPDLRLRHLEPGGHRTDRQLLVDVELLERGPISEPL